ncbi:MAG: winged helix DNA-binding protein [Gemmatimonadales bacterium]|nr:winged helix DNA-binding protein [Gemmatimonadales bacterium]
MLDDAVRVVLSAYPTIHAACRRREVRDPRTGRRLSNHQAGILEHLDPVAPLAVGDLANRLRVTPATISLQLNRLTRLRLVTRIRDVLDGRRVLLRLTEAGQRVRELRSLLDPERVREALERIPDRERDTVVAGLRLLARAAGQLGGNR